MSTIDLETFKAHCRCDDFADDDQYLQHLLDTAEAWVIQATRRGTRELLEMGGGALPLQLQQAAMILGAHWYDQRVPVGGGGQTEIPYTLSTLVKPYVKLVQG